MSVNYYAFGPFPGGDPSGEGLHIGQSAHRVEFLFRAHLELDLVNCAAWHAFLSRPDMRIVAEHGLEYTLSEFWSMATKRPADVGGTNVMGLRWPGGAHRPTEWTDKHGHPFAAHEFF